MKHAKIIISFMGFILLFQGCKSENTLFDDFFTKEKQNLEFATQEAITALGLENYVILVYAHKSINNGIVSKDVSYTNWSGLGFEPEYYSNSLENNVPPTFRENIFGRVIQRTMRANYEPNSKREITYDYFSILIIFENISKLKMDELSGILNSYIINVQRDDNVIIISKEEFNKLE